MNRKIAGLILILIGLLLSLGIMLTVVIIDYHHWINNLDGFQYKYPTFVNMLHSREKAAFLFSLIIGILPTSMGVILYNDKS